MSGSVYGSDEYRYIYDINTVIPRLLVEKDSAGNSNDYLYDGRLFSLIGPEGNMYYHQDGLGSISVITDVYGNPLNRYTYDAFGSLRSVSESVYNPFRFTGEQYDPSGLIYLRARYYNPATGSFISQDTFNGMLNDPLSQNRYVYCGNNPVVYVDPSGHLSVCPPAYVDENYGYDPDVDDPNHKLQLRLLNGGDITAEQLIQLGWQNVTGENVSSLNHALKNYNISTTLQIRHFISQCMKESGLGQWTTELYDGDQVEYFTYMYENDSGLGNTEPGDGYRYRGAGYIQVTGRDNYRAFANDIGDQDIMQGADYVAQNYPWEAAGFWWYNNDMNTVVDNSASVREVTLMVNPGLIKYPTLLEREVEQRTYYYKQTVNVIY